ncbi:MAG: ATP-grasp domain-containing protein [Proteobacteria bacterium]|nr:ATP-grasp domain-containing protein [Pseudomonadota bacterium]
MSRRKLLVFPAGTEIGLEIFEALQHCKEVELHGAGQDVPNHARFVYPRYHLLPSVREAGWVGALADLCATLSIDYIFPAYDDVIVALAEQAAHLLPAKVLCPSLKTCLVTRSKRSTYEALAGDVRVPAVHRSASDVATYPVFVKPDRGQGSQGVRRVANAAELEAALSETVEPLICEFLPGEEYTVDCFTDREHGLLFSGARIRERTRNGISVSTSTVELPGADRLAERIGNRLGLHGAWFFQLKRAADGELALLEVAPRVAGSMSAHRVQGVNFPLLTIFEHERKPLKLLVNDGVVCLDRALRNRYRHPYRYAALYLDFDDTVVVAGRVNLTAIALVHKCIEDGIKVVLLTRHAGDISATLAKHRIQTLFDEVVHLRAGERKSDYITLPAPILVDDSFSERMEVHKRLRIPTFDPSMIEVLLHSQPPDPVSQD